MFVFIIAIVIDRNRYILAGPDFVFIAVSVPILGIVENMSYLHVPEIDKDIDIFGKSRAEEMAASVNAPLLGKLPIDPELAKLCDQGDIEKYTGDITTKLGENLLQLVGTHLK